MKYGDQLERESVPEWSLRMSYPPPLLLCVPQSVVLEEGETKGERIISNLALL